MTIVWQEELLLGFNEEEGGIQGRELILPLFLWEALSMKLRQCWLSGYTNWRGGDDVFKCFGSSKKSFERGCLKDNPRVRGMLPHFKAESDMGMRSSCLIYPTYGGWRYWMQEPMTWGHRDSKREAVHSGLRFEDAECVAGTYRVTFSVGGSS